MNETEDRNPTWWSNFWNYVKNNPLLFSPFIVIFVAAIVGVIFIVPLFENPLFNSLLQMITWTAICCQWIGIARNHEKNKLQRLKSDKEQLDRFARLHQLGHDSHVNFLVPFRASFIKRRWNKFQDQQVLSLYSYTNNAKEHSYTKIHLSTKDLFYLKLRHCIDTKNSDLAMEGLKYLTKNDKQLNTTS